MVRKNSDRMSMARWAGNNIDCRTVRVREGEREVWEVGPAGIPFSGPKVFRVGGVSVPFNASPISPLSATSSACSSTSAKTPLARIHRTRLALLESTMILCRSTLSRNHVSS